ncbi:hypothetical protein TNCT_351 [Trichonephila clavata]|uniref:Uncharacterized protein n=1 Tax=Trichonephila clavata TaxID=2740835 RepID=A0A8X6LV85_TRICU|nr:hypothetical protein TNCT_351 [Trichonephila clavata]
MNSHRLGVRPGSNFRKSPQISLSALIFLREEKTANCLSAFRKPLRFCSGLQFCGFQYCSGLQFCGFQYCSGLQFYGFQLCSGLQFCGFQLCSGLQCCGFQFRSGSSVPDSSFVSGFILAPALQFPRLVFCPAPFRFWVCSSIVLPSGLKKFSDLAVLRQ